MDSSTGLLKRWTSISPSSTNWPRCRARWWRWPAPWSRPSDARGRACSWATVAAHAIASPCLLGWCFKRGYRWKSHLVDQSYRSHHLHFWNTTLPRTLRDLLIFQCSRWRVNLQVFCRQKSGNGRPVCLCLCQSCVRGSQWSCVARDPGYTRPLVTASQEWVMLHKRRTGA